LVLNVVSDDASNCAVPLSCGSTPDGVALTVSGEVDGYSFAGVEGNQVDLDLTEIDPVGPLRLRVFGPGGEPISGADDCDHPVRLDAPSSGRYTVLVSSCGRPRAGRYRLSYEEPGCPTGPNITYFGVASADGNALEPVDQDEDRRPIYERLHGSGLILVVEGRPGMDGRELGITTVGDPLPDMQMLSARTLGDGNPQVCDIMPPNLGGVPGVSDLQFADRDAVRAAVNDLGCRFDNGEGTPGGREFLDACTRSNDGFGFGFVDPGSTLQFCAVVDGSWAFPNGDTILAARLRDEGGSLGMRREIVVRVAEDDTPTVTPTRTPTRTPTPVRSRTRTPTHIAVEGCVGDCDDSGVVQVDELILAVDVALDRSPVDRCKMVDRNGDDQVDVVELLRAVVNSIDGCRDESDGE
jgi:hypothetical protein